MEYSNLCRCCMEIGEINILETVFESLRLPEVIEKCTFTKIGLEDNLPKKICQSCFDKLATAYLFIVKYESVQKSLIELQTSQIIVDKKNVTATEDLQDQFDEENNIGNDYCMNDYNSEFEIKHENVDDVDEGSSDDEKPLIYIFKKLQKNVIESEECIGEQNDKIVHKKRHNCKICTESFVTRSALLFHNKKSNHSKYVCTTCKKSFKGLRELKEHSLKENHENQYKPKHKCQDCSKLFSSISLLEKHKKIHTFSDDENTIHTENDKKENQSDRIHSCTECPEKFIYMKLLEKHCKETGHPCPRRFDCEICSMKFLTKSCLRAHHRTHTKEQPHQCDICGMKFSLRSNLERHKKRHTGEKAFFCEACGRGFIQKHTLTIHMRLHNGETPFVCELCGKGYRAKPLLRQHMNKHNGISTYYKDHYLKHGSVKVECEICKKMLTKSGLYTHMKIQHGDGLKKYLCNLCGKTYTSKKALEIHMNVHTKKVTYDCHICLKSFNHQNYLKTHLRIHSGERPHCCDVCGKTFVQRAHLDGHMRTHTGAKPYTCNYCDKSFALNGNLKVHVRIHTGETPHHCTVCGKGFFDSSSRKKHEATVHQMHQRQ